MNEKRSYQGGCAPSCPTFSLPPPIFIIDQAPIRWVLFIISNIEKKVYVVIILKIMCLPLSKSTVIEVGRRHGLAWQLAILNQKSKVYLLSRPLATATLEEHLPAKKGKQELDISKGGKN